jgi:hypothetical protein
LQEIEFDGLNCDHQILGFGFDLNEMLGIVSNVWQTCCEWPSFNYHEVAWEGACTATEEVYDANLRVGGDGDPVPPAQQ